jgi:carboxymethylenebutenolidase
MRLIFLLALLLALTPAHSATLPVELHRESFLSGGRRIGVETFAPTGTERHPAVLVLHTSAGTLLGKRDLERFSRALAEQGKVAFFVRYFDRTGTTLANDRDIELFTPAWMETVRDAVTFAAAHPRVRPERIGLFGYSLGAYLAVTTAAIDRRIDAVVEVAGGTFGRYEKRLRRLPPTLILHGSADQRVKVSEAYRMQKLARRFGAKAEMKIYPGEGHLLSKAAMEDAKQRGLEFFARHLR